MSCRSSRAFTLIELLVVIVIVSVLAGLLLPLFSSIQEKGRETKCASNLHVLGAGFLLFAGEHDNQLPGSFDTRSNGVNNPDLAYQGSWLSGSNGASSETTNVPRNGTVYPYVGSNDAVYRCPSLHTAAKVGSGKDSNGYFDYAYFCRLAGARLQNIPARARMNANLYPMPMLIEEDPAAYLNSSIKPIEGTFNSEDQAAQTHRQGCNFVSIDGSVHRLEVPKNTPVLAQDWEAVISSTAYLNLGKPAVATYGQWLDGGLVAGQ